MRQKKSKREKANNWESTFFISKSYEGFSFQIVRTNKKDPIDWSIKNEKKISFNEGLAQAAPRLRRKVEKKMKNVKTTSNA